jgi:hypothetical protein
LGLGERNGENYTTCTMFKENVTHGTNNMQRRPNHTRMDTNKGDLKKKAACDGVDCTELAQENLK